MTSTWPEPQVADATAISMARDYKLASLFSLDTDGAIVRVVSGEKIGAIVRLRRTTSCDRRHPARSRDQDGECGR